ncbi:outer membrane beta-barrel protein [Bradyrhizobium sp. NP1]|uniref:outer membrane protein n=1 Tax=Bradyrhizobium sp. NP1 TaxID=3049772 RepID=UPI0025A5302F|nr:outer membrane beta-barrel protein [Bradyrhizobium sp. NP1]WJR79683.1 outer membrane beta-barrel protein [Bradyrhizobium sp. NP1]
MRSFLLSVVMVAALSASVAQAADLPDLPILRGGYTDGLSSGRVNWQGFYFGGQGGFGTSDLNFTGATRTIAAHLLSNTAEEAAGGISQWPVGGKVSVHGHGFGAFAGYNSQWDNVVIGLDFSYMHGTFGGSQTDSLSRLFVDGNGNTDNLTYQSIAAIRVSDLGTLRARAGYAWGVFLPYAFGGVALGQADIIRTANIFGTETSPPPASVTRNVFVTATDSQNSRLVYGYTAGLGVDVMLISCLFLRAEWEYVRLTTSIDTNINTFKAGLGYKF